MGAVAPEHILKELTHLWVSLGKQGETETAAGVLRCTTNDGWTECTVDEAEKRLPDLLGRLQAEGVTVRNVRVREPELEEVFVELAR